MKARLAALTAGERIVLIGGLLLIADLAFMPWYSVDTGRLDVIGFDPTRTGVQDPYPAYGIAAVVLTLIMIAQLLVSRLLAIDLTAPGLPWGQLQLIAGVFVMVVLVIKFVRETEFLGYGAYSAILGGVLVAYGAFVIARESAGLA